MSRPTRLVINLSAAQHNLQRVRELAPSAEVTAVVKANAYGHGAVLLAQHLAADSFAVASLAEAQQLTSAGITQPIILLEGPFAPSDIAVAIAQQYELVIHTPEQLAWLEAQVGDDASVNMLPPVWLKHNSGMNRLGLSAKQIVAAAALLNDRCQQLGLMTHLACADEPNSKTVIAQLKAFIPLLDGWQGPVSIANSAAICAWPQIHANRVRPGIMLYGSSPLLNSTAAELNLKPVMTLQSEIIAVQQVPAGQYIGYGADYFCEQDSTIAVIAMGYGDGYPRHVPVGTPVLINGQRYPLVGRVSMDMLTVDVTAAMAGAAAIQHGDTVTLWGDGLPADEIAAAAGTIAYELFCQITARVMRVVVD